MSAAFTPRRALLTLGLAAWAFALLPYVLTSNYPDDEFTGLYHAVRVLGGQVPYRDFFEFIPPLSFYAAAAAFAVAGPSLLAARVVAVGLLALAAWQLYDLARRAGAPAWLTWQPAFVLCFGLYRHFPAFNHHWLVLPPVLAALQLAQRGRWGPAGALAGVAALVLQTDGAAVALVLLVAAFWSEERRPWAVVGGFLAPVVPMLAYLASQHALGSFVADTWTWPRGHYRVAGGLNDVPYGSDFFRELVYAPEGPLLAANMVYMGLLYALPPAMALVALALLARGARLDPARRVLALAAVASGALAVSGRADIVHIAAYAYPALVLAATFKRAGGVALPLMAGTTLALFLAMVLSRPGTWLVLGSPDQRLAASGIIRYVRAHTAPGDTIVALPWGGFFYFYGRPPATRYSLLTHPREGYTTAAEAHEAFEEIRTHQPKLVLMATEMRGHGHFQLYDHLWEPLPGYSLVAEADMPHDHNGGYGVLVWERSGPGGANRNATKVSAAACTPLERISLLGRP